MHVCSFVFIIAYVLQEPVRVTLGKRRVWKGEGPKRRCVVKEDIMMYIPLLASLQSLLLNRAVLAEVSDCNNY